MWVRSQDKELLIDCKAFAFERERTISFISQGTHKREFIGEGSFNITSGGNILGEYSTKEKALKVLDKIQEHLMPKPIVKPTHLRYEYDIRSNKTLPIAVYDNETITVLPLVFQMPSDEEV